MQPELDRIKPKPLSDLIRLVSLNKKSLAKGTSVNIPVNYFVENKDPGHSITSN